MKKHIKIILILLTLFVLTGCTKYMQTEDKTVLRNEETGQRLVENILCKTETTAIEYERIRDEKIEELINNLENSEFKEQVRELQTNLEDEVISEEEFYTELKNLDEDLYDRIAVLNEQFNTDDAVYCTYFTITTGGYEGIWASFFVKPLAFLLIQVGEFTGNYGWGIVIVTILIRTLLYPITRKTVMQSENMKKVQPKMKKLEEKYRNKKDQQSQVQKNQEMWKIYKENNVNPFGGCLFAFIQIPLFLSFFEALHRLPAVLEERFLGINLGITPGTAFTNGQYQYVLFVVLVVAATYFSFKFNQMSTPGTGNEKQMKMMMNFSIIMISVSAFFISSGIALYWTINSGYTVAQNFIVKRRKKNDHIT